MPIKDPAKRKVNAPCRELGKGGSSRCGHQSKVRRLGILFVALHALVQMARDDCRDVAKQCDGIVESVGNGASRKRGMLLGECRTGLCWVAAISLMRAKALSCKYRCFLEGCRIHQGKRMQGPNRRINNKIVGFFPMPLKSRVVLSYCAKLANVANRTQ